MFTADAVRGEAQDQESEQLLWQLLRSHQERAALTRRMAEKERQPKLSDRLRERASEYDEDAELVRRLLKAVTLSPDAREPSEPAGPGPTS